MFLHRRASGGKRACKLDHSRRDRIRLCEIKKNVVDAHCEIIVSGFVRNNYFKSIRHIHEYYVDLFIYKSFYLSLYMSISIDIDISIFVYLSGLGRATCLIVWLRPRQVLFLCTAVLARPLKLNRKIVRKIDR